MEGDEWIGTGRDQDAVLLLSGAGDAMDKSSALCRDALNALRSMRIHCDLPSATWTDIQLDEHIYVFSGWYALMPNTGVVSSTHSSATSSPYR